MKVYDLDRFLLNFLKSGRRSLSHDIDLLVRFFDTEGIERIRLQDFELKLKVLV